jgi:hypothetical protein
MRRPVFFLALLTALPLAAQVLSPAADGHILRNQTFVFDQANPSVTFGGRTTYFNYFQNLYAGGEDTFTYDFIPGDGRATHYNRELRTILEFDLSSVSVTPGNFTAQLRVTTDGNFYPTEDFLTVEAFDMSPSAQDGSVTQSDYAANTVSLDFQAVDAKAYNKTYAFNVTAAVADDLTHGRTYAGFVLVPDPRNGNEVSFVSSWEAANQGKTGRAQLVFTSTQPDISVTPPAACATPVGQTNSLTVTVANVGQADLHVASVTEEEDPSGRFDLDLGSFNTTIPAGGNSAFIVHFSPAATGEHQARYRILSDDPDESPYDLVLTCQATTSAAPSITVQATACAQIPVNTVHTITVTVGNVGQAPLMIGGVTELSDPFSVYAVDTAGMAASVAPGASTTFHVTFSPRTSGTFTGTVRIASNDPISPAYDLALGCSSVSADAPDIEVTPTSVICAGMTPGQQASQVITVRNVTQSAAGDLYLSAFLLSGDPEYTLDVTGTKLVLKAGEQTTCLVKFQPSATGFFQGTLTINSNDPDTPTVAVVFGCAVTLEGVQTGSVAVPDPAAATVIPASALAAGAYGSFWVTDLKVHNPGAAAATVRVFYLPTQTANASAPYGDFVIASGATLVVPNVLKHLFGMEAGFGTLLLVPQSPAGARVMAVSRTYNQQALGTYGQFIPGVARSAFLSAGSTGVLLGLGKGTHTRTNTGFASGPSGAALSLQLYSGGGAPLGAAVPYTLESNSHIQTSDIFAAAGAATTDNAFALFTVTDGSAFGYASVVNFDDPIFIPMQ